MHVQSLPRFQYTIRCESTGAIFVSYASELSKTYATIENEFFDLENFSGRAHFMATAGTYQHFYNFTRKNRSRTNKTPIELLREKAPNLHPRILLLHPRLLDSPMGQLLSGPPAVFHAAAHCYALYDAGGDGGLASWSKSGSWRRFS
jgi:hypothetical protein